MQIEFNAESEPSGTLCKELADFVPLNPFYTAAYMESRKMLGFEPIILTLRRNNKLISACAAFIKHAFLLKSLEIESLPNLPLPEFFWEGLIRFCRKKGIMRLNINTFASESAIIPNLKGETNRYKRSEYCIKLCQVDLLKQMRATHRQRVNRARKAGVTIKDHIDAEAMQGHFDAVSGSMHRRIRRGEEFNDVDPKIYSAITKAGSAQLFQAILDDKVLSSALIILSTKGAYYYWAGTTKDGMKCGASQFLVYKIAEILQNRGFDIFNLGGTALENKGLVEFKRGFGSVEVVLEAAEFIFCNKTEYKIRKITGLIKENPALFFKRLRNKLK